MGAGGHGRAMRFWLLRLQVGAGKPLALGRPDSRSKAPHRTLVTDPDIPTNDAQTARSKYVPAREAVTGGFSKNADLISYIVAGLLLGLLFDWILGTTPLMVVIWTLLGVGVGYWRLWQSSSELEEEAKDRSHGV